LVIRFLGNISVNPFHFKSTRADVHYASASFGTSPPTYITLPYLGFEPGTFGFQVGNATYHKIENLSMSTSGLNDGWKQVFGVLANKKYSEKVKNKHLKYIQGFIKKLQVIFKFKINLNSKWYKN
jgi:hypothetical protein